MLRYLIRLTFYCILRLWTICLVKKHLLRTWYRTWLSGISGATAKLVENIKLPMKIWFTFSLLRCLSGFCWILMVSVRVALQHVSFDLSDFRAALLSVSSHSATARLKWPYDKLSCWMTEPNSFTWSYLSDFTFLPGTSPSPPPSLTFFSCHWVHEATVNLCFLNLLAFVSLKAKCLSLHSLCSSLIIQAQTSSVPSKAHRWLIHRAAAAFGSSVADWHRPRLQKWIASGVILTCSLTVKSWMFWFILSPLSICLGLFAAMEGFSTKRLVKVGSVYTVHAGRMWCQGIASVAWHPESTYSTYSMTLLYKYSPVYSSLQLPPIICSIDEPTALSQHFFLVLYYAIKAA